MVLRRTPTLSSLPSLVHGARGWTRPFLIWEWARPSLIWEWARTPHRLAPLRYRRCLSCSSPFRPPLSAANRRPSRPRPPPTRRRSRAADAPTSLRTLQGHPSPYPAPATARRLRRRLSAPPVCHGHSVSLRFCPSPRLASPRRASQCSRCPLRCPPSRCPRSRCHRSRCPRGAPSPKPPRRSHSPTSRAAARGSRRASSSPPPAMMLSDGVEYCTRTRLSTS